MTVVVDASVVLDLLLRGQSEEALRARLSTALGHVAAPHLIDLEVAQVLRRFVLRGELAPARARTALEDFRALPLDRYAHGPLLERAFELRSNFTAYDAAYVALAESLEASLITRDEKLASAAGRIVEVERV